MAYKVLGLTAGSAGGSSEMCLKEALQAAATTGATVEMIRVDELRLPTGADPKEPDDGPWYWERLMECDALIVSAPIYSRTVPSRLKILVDKILGPNADTAIIERLLDMRANGEEPSVWFRIDERVLKPRVAGFIGVGGALTTQWKTLYLPIMHTLTLSMQIAVVDQFIISGAGMPKSVVLDGDALKRSATLGANVASQLGRAFNDVEYLGPEGLCPMCHLDVVVLSGRDVECGTCGARGHLGDDFKVTWNDFSGCVITKAERSEHYQEILDTGARQGAQADRIAELAAAYSAFDPVIRPPQ
jgi:multimeric flavodoxin WrbA